MQGWGSLGSKTLESWYQHVLGRLHPEIGAILHLLLKTIKRKKRIFLNINISSGIL
jgi:hypothetical protein